MIEFLTIFLHLVSGVQRVEIAAAPEVAVVLVLGDDLPDTSQHAVADVRRLLEATRVPLYVWRTSPPRPDSEWPEGPVLATPRALRGAADELMADLGRQWIAWVDGVFTPKEIAVVHQP